MKLLVCFWFQIQSDIFPCMTTNTFAISRGIQKGKMWLGGSAGEVEIVIVMSLSDVTVSSLQFLLFVHGNYKLVHSCCVGVVLFTSFVCLMHVVFCVAELLLFQCLQWMTLLFLDPLIKLFDFGISALQIAR